MRTKRPKNPPQFLQPYLWSYNLQDVLLDNPDHRRLVITNILNLGNLKSVHWLFATLPQDEIAETIRQPERGTWSRKSLNFWKVILDIPVPKQKFEQAILNIHPVFERDVSKNS